MTTTRRVRPNRTTGLGQRLAAALILSALLAAFPVPAQAAPIAQGGAPLAGLLSWLEGLLADLGLSPAGPEEGGPEAAFLPDSCSLEPGGSTCSQGARTPVLLIEAEGESLSNRPATR